MISEGLQLAVLGCWSTFFPHFVFELAFFPLIYFVLQKTALFGINLQIIE